MHPILKNIRSAPDQSRLEDLKPYGHDSTCCPETHCGIAATGGLEDQLRSKQREDRQPKPAAPLVDYHRDDKKIYGEGERDLLYKSSACVSLDDSPISSEDFEPDDMGSRAMRHMEASKLVRNGQHTRDVERWQYDTFKSHVFQLLGRPFTSLGVLYLSDFLNTFVELPPNHALTMQLVTILNHTSEPTLRRILKDIGEKDGEGHLKNEWLLQLVNIIEMIFKDEPSDKTRLTAILTVANELALSFAKKASGGNFPTTDRLSKTLTYFRRIILAILNLAESIGCYTNNYSARRPEKRCKVSPETSDESYMFSLKGALEAPESDEEEEWIPA
ncbi:52K [Lizard adenovirus 2]|uniref:52K n=1 Tax=Lizard adenovirus 2 TaxID=874272 RepID=A0A076FTF2_9ADEN|nr:52K [Lizard adenovirus 2]AII22565.1 52K [Lizard adenovirus 2]